MYALLETISNGAACAGVLAEEAALATGAGSSIGPCAGSGVDSSSTSYSPVLAGCLRLRPLPWALLLPLSLDCSKLHQDQNETPMADQKIMEVDCAQKRVSRLCFCTSSSQR